ncbi:TPA: hypothetical protein DCE37_20515 [Candidatus Latescibacteria bacterium]|nr:hypothetical protein [Candidatus Latescibacterota bacterium]
MLARSYIGLSAYQKQHILAWLRTQPWVNCDRIALSGHSLGAEPTVCMAVLDPGIRALVFNDFLSVNRLRYTVMAKPDERWRHNNSLRDVIPGLVELFEFPDLLATIAPLPLIVCEGGAIDHLEPVGRAH